MKTWQTNHFDLARFIAALMVMITHAFALTVRGPSVEPLRYLSGHRADLGVVGVAAFFVMSGYLITGSWQRHPQLGRYLRARLLRILPGLAVALLFCVVAGALLTVRPSSYPWSALSFFVRNLTLYHGQSNLAGVFMNNPVFDTVNGSLWTLRYEFSCYLLVAALGMLGLLRGRMLLPICLAAYVAWEWNWSQYLGLGREATHEFLPLLCWFMAGAWAYTCREVRCPRAWWLTILALAVVTVMAGGNLLLLAPLLALGLIRLLLQPGPLAGFGRYGDFSYGLYIYAFPVQQWLIHLRPEQTPWENLLLAFPLTLLLAVLSWYLVERRFLRLKDRKAPPRAAEFNPVNPPVR